MRRGKHDRQPEPESRPIRRGKVLAYVQAEMELLDGDPDNDAAYRKMHKAAEGLTTAEFRAADDALKRHGYGC